MSLSLISAAVWVVIAAIVGFLPMRFQLLPGLALLLAAPILIGAVGYEHGWLYAAIATAGFVSMFRKPLLFLGRKFFAVPQWPGSKGASQ